MATGETGKPKITFVLVHGTFARGAPWVESEDEGSFREQLRREFEPNFEVHFETADWGESTCIGRLRYDNTLWKRIDGAENLAAQLRSAADAQENDRRYLVAHSHGGSVVIYALTKPELLDKVSGVVCMSSPFLEYKGVALHRDLLFFSAVILVLISADGGGFFMWAYTVVYAAVVLTVMIKHKSAGNENAGQDINDQLQKVKLPNAADLTNSRGAIPFLAIRPHRDEVAGLFWFTRIAGLAFRGTWQILNVIGRWGIYGFVLVRTVELLLEKAMPDVDLTALDSVMSLVDQKLMTPIMLAATAVLLGMVIMRWSYAFDALPWLTWLDPQPRRLPWQGADSIAVDTFNWPAHSGIQPQAPPKIAAWIRNAHKVNPDERLDIDW